MGSQFEGILMTRYEQKRLLGSVKQSFQKCHIRGIGVYNLDSIFTGMFMVLGYSQVWLCTESYSSLPYHGKFPIFCGQWMDQHEKLGKHRSWILPYHVVVMAAGQVPVGALPVTDASGSSEHAPSALPPWSLGLQHKQGNFHNIRFFGYLTKENEVVFCQQNTLFCMFGQTFFLNMLRLGHTERVGVRSVVPRLICAGEF